MSFRATVVKDVVIDGVSMSSDLSVTSNLKQGFDEFFAAAKSGNLSTRTDNDTGTLTMDSGGHGITTGARLDIYWATGSRRGVAVGTVSGTSVPIDLGSGDNLPTQGTLITAMVPISVPIIITGDNTVGLAVKNPAGGAQAAKATFVFAKSDNTEGTHFVVGSGGCGSWFSSEGTTNPIAGDAITQVFVSHGDSGQAINLTGFALYN